MKLRWLKIHRYRDLAPDTELKFSDEWNVILGKNGSGKTTLLQILACILRSDFVPLLNEQFRFEFELVTSNGSIRCDVKNETAPAEDEIKALIAARVDAGEIKKQQRQGFEFSATAELNFGKGVRKVVGRRGGIVIDGAAKDRHGVLPEWFLPSLFFAIMVDEKPSFTASEFWPDFTEVISPVDSLFRFDEALDAFRALVSADDVGGHGRASPHLFAVLPPNPPETGVGPLAPPQLTSSFLPNEVLTAALTALAQRPDPPADIALSAEDLPILGDVARLFGFKNATATLLFREKAVHQDRISIVYGPLAFRFQTLGDAVFNHGDLSYGQKRLLAFLYYAAVNRSFIVADELVNGLHHEWIEAAIKATTGRQRFLTSQNPLLFDFLEFDSADAVLATFIKCTCDGGVMSWRNFSKQQARRVYAAYDAGIQHVGEILRLESLW